VWLLALTLRRRDNTLLKTRYEKCSAQYHVASGAEPLGRSWKELSLWASFGAWNVQRGKMSEDRVAYPYPYTTLEDIRITAQRLGLPFNESQLTRVHKAVLSIEDSAARLRQGLHRNDEPAFGVRLPAGEPK